MGWFLLSRQLLENFSGSAGKGVGNLIECGGVVHLVRTPVTQEATGSNPVAPPEFQSHSLKALSFTSRGR